MGRKRNNKKQVTEAAHEGDTAGHTGLIVVAYRIEGDEGREGEWKEVVADLSMMVGAINGSRRSVDFRIVLPAGEPTNPFLHTVTHQHPSCQRVFPALVQGRDFELSGGSEGHSMVVRVKPAPMSGSMFISTGTKYRVGESVVNAFPEDLASQLLDADYPARLCEPRSAMNPLAQLVDTLGAGICERPYNEFKRRDTPFDESWYPKNRSALRALLRTGFAAGEVQYFVIGAAEVGEERLRKDIGVVSVWDEYRVVVEQKQLSELPNSHPAALEWAYREECNRVKNRVLKDVEKHVGGLGAGLHPNLLPGAVTADVLCHLPSPAVLAAVHRVRSEVCAAAVVSRHEDPQAALLAHPDLCVAVDTDGALVFVHREGPSCGAPGHTVCRVSCFVPRTVVAFKIVADGLWRLQTDQVVPLTEPGGDKMRWGGLLVASARMRAAHAADRLRPFVRSDAISLFATGAKDDLEAVRPFICRPIEWIDGDDSVRLRALRGVAAVFFVCVGRNSNSSDLYSLCHRLAVRGTVVLVLCSTALPAAWPAAVHCDDYLLLEDPYGCTLRLGLERHLVMVPRLKAFASAELDNDERKRAVKYLRGSCGARAIESDWALLRGVAVPRSCVPGIRETIVQRARERASGVFAIEQPIRGAGSATVLLQVADAMANDDIPVRLLMGSGVGDRDVQEVVQLIQNLALGRTSLVVLTTASPKKATILLDEVRRRSRAALMIVVPFDQLGLDGPRVLPKNIQSVGSLTGVLSPPEVEQFSVRYANFFGDLSDSPFKKLNLLMLYPLAARSCGMILRSEELADYGNLTEDEPCRFFGACRRWVRAVTGLCGDELERAQGMPPNADAVVCEAAFRAVFVGIEPHDSVKTTTLPLWPSVAALVDASGEGCVRFRHWIAAIYVLEAYDVLCSCPSSTGAAAGENMGKAGMEDANAFRFSISKQEFKKQLRNVMSATDPDNIVAVARAIFEGRELCSLFMNFVLSVPTDRKKAIDEIEKMLMDCIPSNDSQLRASVGVHCTVFISKLCRWLSSSGESNRGRLLLAEHALLKSTLARNQVRDLPSADIRLIEFNHIMCSVNLVCAKYALTPMDKLVDVADETDVEQSLGVHLINESDDFSKANKRAGIKKMVENWEDKCRKSSTTRYKDATGRYKQK